MPSVYVALYNRREGGFRALEWNFVRGGEGREHFILGPFPKREGGETGQGEGAIPRKVFGTQD